MPERPPSSNGPVFFSSSASAKRRWRRSLFIALVLAATLALIWPIYPLFGTAFPLMLGLPPSLVWVVGWLAVVFAALAWLYRAEET